MRLDLATLLCVASACSAASPTPVALPSPTPLPPSIESFAFLEGDWEGELTYLDYGDDTTQVTLATRAVFRREGPVIRFTYIYREPDGREVADAGMVSVDGDGRVTFGPETYSLVEAPPEGDARVEERRLARQGTDKGRPVDVVRVLRRAGSSLTITKVISVAGRAPFERNRYTLRAVSEAARQPTRP